MKLLLGIVLASSMAVSSLAWAGEGCGAHAKKTASKKSCSWDKTAKGKGCNGCGDFAKGNASLKVAATNVEVIKTKTGYIVMATADSSDAVAKIQTINAARLKSLSDWVASASKKACKDCTSFAASVKAGDISFEEVKVSNGVMTVYTANTTAAAKVLAASCGAFWGLKADAKTMKAKSS